MQITGKDLLRLLNGKGCSVTPGKGSHVRVDCGRCVTTVSVHAGETIPDGTLSRIKRDLALSRERVAEMKYRAVYEREPDGRWTVEIPRVRGCHTYGRTIEQARERIREALDLFVRDAGAVEIVDDVKLPADLKTEVKRARRLREKVSRDEQLMTAAQAKAVMAMRKMKLGHRDAGQLLGLSHQRVQQLETRQASISVSARRVSALSADTSVERSGSASVRQVVRMATKKR